MQPLRQVDMTGEPSVCFMTSSYQRDIERFALLRESIRVFAPDIPHIVLVNTEDQGQFRARFGAEPGLEIVTTADVLPGFVECRRRKSGLKWLTSSRLRFWGPPQIKGWHAQQLAKIFGLASCRYDAAIFLDSDVLICRPLEREWFFVDGRLKLFRQMALNAEALDYDISTHDILGNRLHNIVDLFDYIFNPACFRKCTAARILDELVRRRRAEARWIKRFLKEPRPSEYNLLGYAATVLDQMQGYYLTECAPGELCHSVRFPEDSSRFDEEMAHMLMQPKRFALIQSSLNIDTIRISRAFRQLTGGSGGLRHPPCR
jgi:hypothetical protein